MALNIDDFVDEYLEELHENIEKIDTGIIILKKDPNNEDKLSEILRLLHTIKGSSRMLKFGTIEKIAHGLENVFKGIKEKRYEIDKKNIQLIFTANDYMKYGEYLIKTTKTDDFPIKELLAVMEKTHSNEPYNINKIKSLLPKKDSVESTDNSTEINSSIPNKKNNSKIIEQGPEKIEYESVRIKTANIDGILTKINALILHQFQFKREQSCISKLENNYEEMMGLLRRTSGIKLFDEYIKKESLFFRDIQTIRKNFTELMEQIEAMTFEAQESVLNLKMLPLSIVLGSFPKMVEELAIELDKEVDFTIAGDDLRLDKAILESIKDPLIHIVRNAIDHGIETPKRRKELGKNTVGKISIHCKAEGASVVIEIEDDGAGIDYDRIRKKAIAFDSSNSEEIKKMQDQELVKYLFMPGFSTSSKVTDISGRGVGMDIVQNKIKNVKGKIKINSKLNQGTQFVISLPLSLATTSGFFITAASEKFFIPSNFVAKIIMLNEEPNMDILNKSVFKLKDKIVPLYRLKTIIDKKSIPLENEDESVVVVESFGNTIGIIVDSVIEYTSLIFKPLPKILRNLKYVDGIVFDENFSIVNILRVDLLIEKFKELKNTDLKKRFNQNKKQHKRIMVVDDSLNTRAIIISILRSNGYVAVEAADGIEAMNQLKNYAIDLLITDINMPRMDGFTLIENMRRDEKFGKIPIVVMSSYKEDKYIETGKKLGAKEYIVKANFDRNNLLDVVQRIVGV